MSNRVYYIGIGAPSPLTESSVLLVDRALNPLGDWVRLNDRTWFCSTGHSSEELYEEIHDRMPWLDRIVVIALDPGERFGLAPEWLWDWIDGQRQNPPKTVAAIIGERSHFSAEAARDPAVPQAAEG